MYQGCWLSSLTRYVLSNHKESKSLYTLISLPPLTPHATWCRHGLAEHPEDRMIQAPVVSNMQVNVSWWEGEQRFELAGRTCRSWLKCWALPACLHTSCTMQRQLHHLILLLHLVHALCHGWIRYATGVSMVCRYVHCDNHESCSRNPTASNCRQAVVTVA